MKSAIKGIIIILFVIGLSPVLAFFNYDVLYFQPRVAEIESLISSATDEERNLTVTASKLLKIEFNDKYYAYSSKLITYKLNAVSQKHTHLYQQLTSMLWAHLIQLHLSTTDQKIIIAAYSPTGNNLVGFSATAKARYDKDLTSLSPQETATIVALTRAPGTYSASEERLNQRRDFLLNELSNYYPGDLSLQK